jgi:hypothetical protein
VTSPAAGPPGGHPRVQHAVRLRRELHHDPMGPVAAANDWLATHLAVVFGVAWTIWVFFIVPVVAYFLPPPVQGKIFFFSSGWIQLFALPLMVYVGNKLQRSSDAQSETQHQALTHIAVTGDDVKTLLARNTDLTTEIRDAAEKAHRIAADTHRHLTGLHHPDAPGTEMRKTGDGKTEGSTP